LKGETNSLPFFIKKEEDLQNRKENERKRKTKKRIYKRKCSIVIFQKKEK
jgi:hypothetical protein